jgi:HD domain
MTQESPTSLVQRAQEFATNAHKRIDHKRKYTQQPYTVHLATVAKIVNSVTDDEEMIAAAWLHDVVEDTPATLYEIETSFGVDVAELVENLTDISKPSDGNRQQRKEIDRRHIAAATVRAKTVKLADLIDNCRDICKHDPRFATTFLKEMNTMLAVLTEGDPELFKQARNAHDRCQHKLSSRAESIRTEPANITARSLSANPHLVRLFTEAFTAQDIADPVRSFDTGTSCDHVKAVMDEHDLEVVCLREQGVIIGYARRAELLEGVCGEYARDFREGQVIPGTNSLSDVIHILTLQEFGFISVLGDIAGYVSRSDINKPVVRMWLFGIITFVEMEIMRLIEEYFPNDSWIPAITEERAERAKVMQDERRRRGQHCSLLDCLQLSDKGRILISNEQTLALIGLDSRRNAKKIIREVESLRNNLAHAQDIVTYDWAQIVRFTHRIEETLSLQQS